jgi:flavodoxin
MKKTPKEDTTMKNVLIGYYSRTGSTEEMAKYLAEGIRISGNNVDVKKISEIKSEKDLDGYDGFIFGCPTYHKDITENFKTFLCGESPGIIFDTMEHVYKMRMTDLGPFGLKESMIKSEEGRKACQDYGRDFGGRL